MAQILRNTFQRMPEYIHNILLVRAAICMLRLKTFQTTIVMADDLLGITLSSRQFLS